MDNRYLATIVTVCLNSAETISRTIESIASQKDGSLQYIVIDGGSTDGTAEVVRAAGPVVDVFISEPDNGIADAFSKGIRHAQGDVVGLINADDILLPGALQKVREQFTAFPETEVLHADILLYDRDVFVKKIAPPRFWWYPWRLVLFNHPATFVRRHVYRDHGLFDLSYRYAMDDDLFLTWLRRRVILRYVPVPLVQMQSGGLSGQHPVRVFLEKRRALLSHGYPRLLVDIQFVCRLLVQYVVWMQAAWRCRRDYLK